MTRRRHSDNLKQPLLPRVLTPVGGADRSRDQKGDPSGQIKVRVPRWEESPPVSMGDLREVGVVSWDLVGSVGAVFVA